MASKSTQELEQIIGLLGNLSRSISAAKRELGNVPQGLKPAVEHMQRLVILQETYNRLLQQARSAGGGRVPVASGGHPQQAGYGESALEPDLSMYKTKSERMKIAKSVEEQARVEEAGSKLSHKLLADQRTANERMLIAQNKRAVIAERAAAEEQRKASLRARVTNDPAYREYIQQLQSRGLGVDDIQSAVNRGGGITQVTAARNVGGINNKYQGFVNERTGSSTPGLSSQFRSFGSDIIRDIGQFTKWSIAIAAVYTPMQKLGELITIMIDNESRLADATIAANIPFERAGEIFDASAEAANSAGESINSTIDAYAQAVRAVGRYNTEAEKSQKATALLSDSLILSKLSTLDQAQAIDTLSAALLQSDRELDQGQELLNKWVRVSQIANVSIDGLATGVAVLGDSAETVGLSIDQLNGLIAVLSEQSISGSKEAANTAKALVGAYQSDKAEAALNKYGVALRKANGEVRGFLEIYQDLARLRGEGVLSEEAVSEVALALGGGGVRRAKDASALINSTERLNKIAEESANITGKDELANDALAKKLETVQTSTTRLANSFQELAQTLGDDGGLLDLFKGLLDLLTGVTSAADDMFTLMGRSGPVLATFTTGLLALTALGPNRRNTMLAQLQKGGFQGFLGGQAQYGYGGGIGGYGRNILGDILQMNKRGGTIVGGAAVIGSAASNLQAGRNEQAIANVVGGVIGAAIGGTLSGGIGIAAGAAIGSSVADSFVTGVLRHSGEIQTYFTPIIPFGGGGSTAQGGQEVQPRERTTAELINEMYKIIGGGNEFVGGLRAKGAYAATRLTPGETYASSESWALEKLKNLAQQQGGEAATLYSQLQARNQFQNAQQGTLAPGTSEADIARNRRQVQDLQRLAEAERSRQLERVSRGEVRPAEFGRISERLAGFPTAAFQGVSAFGDSFMELSKDINTTSDAYNAFLELTVSGTDEQQQQTNQYISDIQKLQAELDNFTGAPLELTTGTKAFGSRGDVQQQLATVQQQAAQFTNAAIINARLQKTQLPPVIGSYTEAVSKQDEQKIIEEGLRIQQKYYEDVGASAEEIKYLVSNIEAFSVYTDDAGKKFYDTVEGLNQWAYEASRKSLEELGKIASQQGGIGFQKYDVPISTLETLAQRSLSLGQSWQKKFNYDFKPEDQIAIDNKGIVQPLHADFKILALLLEKIVDQNQKQLDGQYNIPEGATFWVPLTAAYYRRSAETGGGLSDMLANMDFQENTSATDRNTRALEDAALAFRGDRGYSREAAANKANTEAALGFRGDRGYSRMTPQQRAELLKNGTIGAQAGGVVARRGEQLAEDLNKVVNPALGFRGDLGYSRRAATVGASTQVSSPSTRLDLRLSSNINLMVDGRVLANAMQTYLASELLRTEQSQGTITKKYTI